MSVVVNSILLVCISCDRYMAIVRIVKGHWEPGKLFSLTCCVLIWAMAAGVSSPMLTLYDFQSIYITKEPPSGEGDDLYAGHLCASETVNSFNFYRNSEKKFPFAERQCILLLNNLFLHLRTHAHNFCLVKFDCRKRNLYSKSHYEGAVQ